ncbi:MAG: hypothetical protein EA357_03325 [Micavibrio sp.]|jgi:hypothetical protein|nr:MAG: hypothetical protein EA357_03325 [Micavibrio sp.]
MKVLDFKNTGLPENENIKKAFDLGLKSHIRRFDEELMMAHRSIEAQLNQQFEMIKRSGQYNEEQLKQLKKQQEHAINQIKDQVENQLMSTRDQDFSARVIEPAKIVADSDPAAENVVSAILVLETVRSPKDYENIKSALGEKVSGIVSEILDMEAYPSEKNNKIAGMSDDSKRANLALMVGGLQSLANMAKQLPPGQKVMMVGGRDAAKHKIDFASAVRGVDSKLDDLFVNAFNDANQVVEMGVRVEVDKDSNTLKAVHVDVAPPGADGKPPQGPGIGGGFFDDGGDKKGPATPPSKGFGGGGNKKLGGGF